MTLHEFTRRTTALHDALQQQGVIGLLMLGSSAFETRRDEWSDHDFFVITEPDDVARVRNVMAWIPDSERVVSLAREGSMGFSVLFDDGHIFEFAVGQLKEYQGIAISPDHSALIDDGPVQTLVEDAAGVPVTPSDPLNEVLLALTKLLIGVGRARRGEIINGGQMVRTWALNHLLRALRDLLEDSAGSEPLDPTRRFETAHPEIGAAISAAIDRPTEDCAKQLHSLIKEVLAPRWEQFPHAAHATVARRLGW
ncbi:hypothetical protein [Pseudarthrobacter oxydans]|uniref:hypothetical protein n=1 Tax=Pseudarthrobacter oxydans TaxID=1671 RepID=UPI001574C843|nr:hypothetical protein [Pseudarthrobacter oxydans]MDV2981318.1 hypothetical protein [Actinomycetes bacterium ARC8]NSX37422.1 hypothetical protein [Pseudarthrobacter oxydans]BFE46329.1 hypothetical protein GCM10017547_42220 [Pseudarthrobacter oxydans]